MPFVLSSKATFNFVVKVARPAENGRWEHFEFVAEFKKRTRPEVEEMVNKGLPKDADILAAELVGWKGVKASDGTDLTVSDENRAVLLAEPHVQAAIVRAWLEAVVQGPSKN